MIAAYDLLYLPTVRLHVWGFFFYILKVKVVSFCLWFRYFSYGASKTNAPAAPSWPHLLSLDSDVDVLRAWKLRFPETCHESRSKAFWGLSICLFVLLLPVVTHEPFDAEQLRGDKSGRKVYYAAVATWQRTHNNGNSSGSNNKQGLPGKRRLITVMISGGWKHSSTAVLNNRSKKKRKKNQQMHLI